MSGICGLWALDGSPAPDGAIAAMTALLERRGPDGSSRRHDGAVALGHALLATTPEALAETMPLADPASGCIITADARLDNRDELIVALGLAGETRTIGDGELILRAYLQWGEDCPAQLLGDFAFAIWDPRGPRLFAARDQMGMRQLLYHHAPGRLFAFATEAEALLAHPDVPRRVNAGRVADYLDRLEGLDLTSTFLDDVHRLPPAHRLTVDAGRLAISRYSRLEPGPELQLDGDQAYVDAFLNIFREAVRCRLRSAGPIGSMLSGGLDSNSVVAVAADLLATAGEAPLATFSAVSGNPGTCAESRTIELATRSPKVAPRLVSDHDLARSPDDVLCPVQASAEPFDAHMVLHHAVYRLAHQAGIKVMLDGAGADVVMTPGNRVAGLLRRLQVAAAIKEARREADFWGAAWPARTILLSSAWAAFAPDWLRNLRRRLGWWRDDRQLARGRDRVSADFARATDLAGRRRRFRRHLSPDRPNTQSYRACSIRHPHLAVARERYDRVAAAHGIEPRDPYMDVRLIRFLLSLPPAQLQADGWPKAILRRAMAGFLPDAIAWRRGKPHLGWAFTTALIDAWQAEPGQLTTDEPVIALMAPKRVASALAGVDKEAYFELTVLREWLGRNSSDRTIFRGNGE